MIPLGRSTLERGEEGKSKSCQQEGETKFKMDMSCASPFLGAMEEQQVR